jgi:pimeloyl-ACP methyl ester carboxylesterase
VPRPPARRARRTRFGARAAATGLVLALAVALVACTSTVPGVAMPASTASVPTAGGSITTSPRSSAQGSPAPVPAGLEKFYGQALDWGSCAPLATTEENKFYRSAVLQCADLTVPLAYAEPDGKQITLKVLRKPATSTTGRIGSVVINPGGPGGSGVEYAGYMGARGIGKELNGEFDIVGFDPRGVGASVPAVRCQTDAEREAARAINIRTRSQEDVDAANAVSEQIAKGCASLTGADQGIDGTTFLANIGTRDVAKDLDVLRAALGDQQLTYIGWSYGTSIGTQYAEQFPKNVRAMILDGALDPETDPMTRDVAQGAAFQQAFDDYAAWCAQQSACVLGTDPSKATAAYQALVRPLLDTPLPVVGGRSLSFTDATTGTNQALYSESLWKPLSAALLDLSNGDGAAMMSLADIYDGRDSKGHYSNSLDAFLAIGCIDGLRQVDPATDDEYATKYAAAAPFQATGDPPKGVKDPCAYWPAQPTSTAHVPQVDGLPRILVISTTNDPATPYQAGVNLAKALGASLLTVNGTNHTAYLNIGSKCVDRIGTDYLTTLELPASDTSCR